MTYTQRTTCTASSESVSYSRSYFMPLEPLLAMSGNVLSIDDQEKLEYAMEKHKEGLKLLSL